ncbi:RNA-dependent RNA polymerase 6 [Ixodes scapularis]
MQQREWVRNRRKAAVALTSTASSASDYLVKEHIACLESRRQEQNQRCKGRRRANVTDDDCATKAKCKRESRRRLHSTPAEQFPGVTAMFRTEFVDYPFGVKALCATNSDILQALNRPLQVIQAEQRSTRLWELTAEGQEVAEKGSHEALVFQAIPPQGISQQLLMKNVPNAKVGFSKAMSLGWVRLDKTGDGGPTAFRKVDEIEDRAQQYLAAIQRRCPDQVPDAQKQDLKKRKLLSEVLYGTLARKWCTVGVASSRLLQWLKPNRDRGFKRRVKPYEHEIGLHSLSFGTFAGLSIFAESHLIGSGHYELKCVFKHDERTLEIYLTPRHVCSDYEIDDYQLSIPYGSILRLVVNDSEDRAGTTDIFLHVRALPLLYRRESRSSGLNDDWLLLALAVKRDPMFNRSLSFGCSCLSVLHSRDLGGNSVLKLSFADRQKAQKILERLSWRCRRSTEFLYSPVETREVGSQLKATKELLDARLMPYLRYPCYYALHAVFQQGNDAVAQMVLLKASIFETFVQNLIEFARNNEGALEQTLFGIRAAIEDRHIINVHSAVPELFEKFRNTYAPPQGSTWLMPGAARVRDPVARLLPPAQRSLREQGAAAVRR